MPVCHRCCRCLRLFLDDDFGVGNTLVCPTCHQALKSHAVVAIVPPQAIPRTKHVHVVRLHPGAGVLEWRVPAIASVLVLLLVASAVAVLSIRKDEPRARATREVQVVTPEPSTREGTAQKESVAD